MEITKGQGGSAKEGRHCSCEKEEGLWNETEEGQCGYRTGQ